MPDRPESTSPPPWNESDSFRETTLLWIETVASYCTSWSSDLGSELDLR
jgi:hypothetical protein